MCLFPCSVSSLAIGQVLLHQNHSGFKIFPVHLLICVHVCICIHIELLTPHYITMLPSKMFGQGHGGSLLIQNQNDSGCKEHE